MPTKRATKSTKKTSRATLKPARAPRKLDDLVARDIMQAPIVTVPLSASLADVQQVLADNRISGVPVTNEGGKILGVISSKDLLDRYAEDGEPASARPHYFATTDDLVDDTDGAGHFERDESASDLTAADVMTPEVFSVPATTALRALAKRMVEWNVHRVMVADRGRHVGLISTMDVLAAIARSR